jgi:hypothetical protein
MRTLPTTMIRVLAPFAPLFSKRVFQHAQTLVAGAILAPGRRTVSSALRAMGLDQEKRFHRYHRVLSRASWSSRKASGVHLGLVVKTFVPEGGPLVVGIDETLERRWGKKISAKGVYRDPVLHRALPTTVAVRDHDLLPAGRRIFGNGREVRHTLALEPRPAHLAGKARLSRLVEGSVQP